MAKIPKCQVNTPNTLYPFISKIILNGIKKKACVVLK